MAKNKKALLNEGTVRRMMKLANMDALGDGFITERFGVEEDQGFNNPANPRSRYMQEQDEEEAGLDLGAEEEVETPEGAEGDEGAEMDVDMEMDTEGEEMEGEVTITDDEAQDIIALADKLRGAVEGGGEEEVDIEAELEGPEGEMGFGEEEELDLEDPGSRGMYEEELYEAALKGLEINIVDDAPQKRQALVQEVKSRIYKRVVDRLLKESKAPVKESKAPVKESKAPTKVSQPKRRLRRKKK